MNEGTNLFQDEPANACRAFQNLHTPKTEQSAAARAHCEDLWRDFAQHADTNFVREFATQTHARWFEMYLTVTLMRAGFTVECRKPGPDILVTVNGQRFWIEAIAATGGEPGKPDSVAPPKFDGEFHDTPVREMALRIRAALEEKARKFASYQQKGIVAPGDVLVVALNVHDIPWAFADMEPLMKRAFYGVGDLVMEISRETLKAVSQHNQQLTHIEKRSTGAEVGVMPFIDGSMSHVSAGLGSLSDAWNLPRHLGDDLHLFPNLTAAVRWPAGAISIGHEWKFVVDPKDGWNGTLVNHPSGPLTIPEPRPDPQ